jgi:hypothetical protein
MALLSMLSLPGPIFSTALPFRHGLVSVKSPATCICSVPAAIAQRKRDAAAQRVARVFGVPAAIADGDTIRAISHGRSSIGSTSRAA